MPLLSLSLELSFDNCLLSYFQLGQMERKAWLGHLGYFYTFCFFSLSPFPNFRKFRLTRSGVRRRYTYLKGRYEMLLFIRLLSLTPTSTPTLRNFSGGRKTSGAGTRNCGSGTTYISSTQRPQEMSGDKIESISFFSRSLCSETFSSQFLTSVTLSCNPEDSVLSYFISCVIIPRTWPRLMS